MSRTPFCVVQALQGVRFVHLRSVLKTVGNNLGRTRIEFPDYTPDQPGEDTFELMAARGVQIIDRVVVEEMGGGIDPKGDVWFIPHSQAKIEPTLLEVKTK